MSAIFEFLDLPELVRRDRAGAMPATGSRAADAGSAGSEGLPSSAGAGVSKIREYVRNENAPCHGPSIDPTIWEHEITGSLSCPAIAEGGPRVMTTAYSFLPARKGKLSAGPDVTNPARRTFSKDTTC